MNVAGHPDPFAEPDQDTCTVVVGALARVEVAARARVAQQLSALDGISTFDVDQDPEGEHRLGVLVEAGSLDQAHDRVRDAVQRVPGVLAAWPVAIEIDAAPSTPRGMS